MKNAGRTGSDLYGRGVFTTLAVVENEPFLWGKHWQRLTSNAAALGIDVSAHAEERVRDSLLYSIPKSGVANGRARITFSDESPSRIWSNDESERKSSLSIIVAERRPVPENFRLTVSRHHLSTTSPLTGVKSCNYLDHLLAYEQATNRGFHEAIRLNERDEIASACMANVFWETDGRLFTPALKTGCLSGTTREYILETIECAEMEVGLEDLRKADRIFLTSAGLGVATVAEFQGRRLDTSDHPLCNLLPF